MQIFKHIAAAALLALGTLTTSGTNQPATLAGTQPAAGVIQASSSQGVQASALPVDKAGLTTSGTNQPATLAGTQPAAASSALSGSTATQLTAQASQPTGQNATSGLRELEGSFLEQIEPRDSILIADQLRYGFILKDVAEGTGLAMQDWSKAFGDTLIVVRNWSLDTLKTVTPKKKSGDTPRYDISADIILAPFEPGKYHLPRIAVQRTLAGGLVDTLLFDPQEMEVTTIPVDTTTFQIHDIKGQIRYPLTFREILPYLLGAMLLAAIIVVVVYYIRRYLRRKRGGAEHKDPPYIVALRALEHYRGDKLWAPEKQKTFYSGITDTLRQYMAETFGIDAREMITADIFSALKGNEKVPADLYLDAKELFELADFVKFAKHTVGADELAKAVPSAVRFVTATYQSQLDDPQSGRPGAADESANAEAGRTEDVKKTDETGTEDDIAAIYGPKVKTAGQPGAAGSVAEEAVGRTKETEKVKTAGQPETDTTETIEK